MGLEHIKENDFDNDLSTICNEINDCILDFCSEQNINDLRETSQSVFSAMLMYINNRLFKNTDRLKNKPKRENIAYNGGYTNYNAYNTTLCIGIMEYYLYITKLYDKECSLKGYEYLTGITQETLNQWGKGGRGASPASAEIVKRLRAERENSLSEKLLTGKNPVGVLGILNHFYGWSGVGNMQEDRTKQAATLTDASAGVLELCDNSGATVNGLAENRQLELSDNFIQKEKP